MKKHNFEKKWFIFRTALLLILLLFPIQMHSASLEEIMSYAFPSSLVVSSKGDLAAWIFNTKGIRNIWTAEGPQYTARQLTSYAEDDGQELSQLSFSADGSIIVYVRGGNPNRSGEYPNPTSDPVGAEQAIWAIKVEGGNPWRIGEGSHPVLSPVDNQVVFTSREGIYIAALEVESKPKLLFKARGRNGSLTWSPDGTRLAFVSNREDHSFIGIHEFNRRKIQWMAPSVDLDGYPVWSPCGKFIAFIRFFSGTSYGTRRGARFSLLVGNVDNLEAETIWTCPNQTGGFSQYYPAQTLRWAADGYLVFYSEHEKWMHLYSISVKDKKIISLTPGEYEVEESFLSPDRKTMIFNSNKDDIDRRHIWSVPVSGGESKLLTPGKGIEWAPVLTSKGKDLIFLCSTAYQPAAPALMDVQKSKIRLIIPEVLPQGFHFEELIEPQQVVFKAPDGLRIHGQLFLPREAKAGDKRAAIIFMHGGPIRQMLLGWHMRGYYHNAYAMNQYLALQGYVVLSVNYRSGIGYGFDFRTAPNQGPRGASEYQDIVAAGKYLQNRPEVDPDKIGLWGGSYGGYLTAMGLARDSELFAAGVDLHGVHDWSLRARRRNGGGWEIRGEDLMSVAYQSSPVADVDFWTSPVLFVHGDDDRNVDFIQTTDLVQRLRRLGKAHIELVIIPDEVHGFLRHQNWLKVYRATADFFDRMLKTD